MFYSQFILAKKGPLGTIWIAAHLERKLRKNQVADTDIGVSVDSIIFPEVPIALRLSSHLLLGVVRIYNRKVNYLFDDCSEALLKIKQAFRSTAVDLPPEQSKAPYHSITLPETFDLDDFELPDNDILHGNYVDHHISSREQITLQDSMEGVSYSTSKFGLDERFGDGDASGLDPDEELFLQKLGSAAHADESAEPLATFGSITHPREDGHYEDNNINLENKVDGTDEFTGLMDNAHAPCTPGLVEEPNLSSVQEVSACDDHLESEYHLTESTLRDNSKSIICKDKQDVHWGSNDVSNCDASLPLVENGYQSGVLEIKDSKQQGESTIIDADVGHVSLDESSSVYIPSSELADHIEAPDVDYRVDIPNEVINKETPHCHVVNEPCHDQGLNTVDSESIPIKDKSSLGVEVPGSFEHARNHEKSYLNTQSQTYQEPTNSSVLKEDVPEKVVTSETPFLRPCDSNLEQPAMAKSGCSRSADTDVLADTALATSGRETETTGKVSCVTDNAGQSLKANHVQEQVLGKDFDASSREPDGQVCCANSKERLVENLNGFEESQIPAPEKLLSVPDGSADLHGNMLEEVLPKEFEGLDEGDAGSKIFSGKKRSFTESTLTEQSLNSAESSRLVRVKRTAESVPDDDDLLSSILAGRRTSVMKVKPTPPFHEVTSMKRNRSAPRSGPPKRKVLMDDTMVLHGDTIRQQLTNAEDIRRVRKKAPCTRPEISMIQKQFLEDEIFRDAILTGLSIELATLYSQERDMSGIRICENDAMVSSVDVVVESRLPSQNNDNVVCTGTVTETDLDFYSDKHNSFLEIAVEPHLSSSNAENVLSPLIESDNGFSGPNLAEHSGIGANCELNLVSDSEIAIPCENPPVSDCKLEECNIDQDQIEAIHITESKVSQQEILMDVAGMKTNDEIFNSVDADVIAEPESVEHSDRNNDTACRLQAGLNDNYEKNSSLDNNEPNVLRDPAMMDLENRQVICGDETEEKNDFVNEVSPRFGLHGRDGFCLTPGNDTEFLNVDDDELDDLADDYMPDDEEMRVTDNSGWSSRTRAVSKYLQMMFVKEAEFGRKSLSMDSLLIGKSRKEASRLFFEALVLKTRDYIHVEQHNPVDDITIKPHTRLIKSDF
ncbi:sister chromatid cohesion 1 protein 4 [Dorcoceras hygrometricum]|uniref:Sister chromatid cohesion 1 protein 4 n=1 Tax=Dorcoceras hygrometricum TaxID=472368 RepID=A0A2Z7BSB5_9LAMI|nr:sister chromatid cohesion 1 protein 4 [Dorcoceras hygrometricum]